MSFLAPFYLLAGLAIGLPILFHLIRRTPRGRQVFSSLMFLSPSPPRMTRRRWIDNWLLLLLRIAAIVLLALAFARPFLQARTQPETSAPRKEILILLDRSASMQRPGYWERAQAQAIEVIRNTGPEDAVQVQLFDQSTEAVMSFSEWKQLPSSSRRQTLGERLSTLEPGWGGTAAGRLLLEAALQFQNDGRNGSVRQRVVLISDMQMGGGWDALSATEWPENVRLEVLDVSQPGESNASVHLALDSRQPAQDLRFRISNAPNSERDSLKLRWNDRFSPPDDEADSLRGETIYVAAGQSRIVTPSSPSADSSHWTLELSGDDVLFDNLCHVVPRRPREIHVVYAGSAEEENNSRSLQFFLAPLFPDDASRTVKIVHWSPAEPVPDVPDQRPDWIIIGSELNSAQQEWLKRWLHDGGQALFVARNPMQAQSLYGLLGLPDAPVEEARVPDHVLLGRVDLDHPLLEQFRDPRFSDFTKLRFWKYRTFDLASLPESRVLAEFETEDPAFIEIRLGNGKLMLLASGWNRDDSDLAVWSKFVPLMNRLLELACRRKGIARQRHVGEILTLKEFGFDQKTVAIRVGENRFVRPREESFQLLKPGFYRFAGTVDALDGDEAIMMAVNLPPEESRTESYPLELLAAAGIPFQSQWDGPVRAEREQQHQQEQLSSELESHQQWWRWILMSALILIGLESGLALWKS